MDILKVCLERWKAETPKFFKGVQKLSLTLGTSAVSVWVINDTMNLELPEVILSICKYVIAIAAGLREIASVIAALSAMRDCGPNVLGRV